MLMYRPRAARWRRTRPAGRPADNNVVELTDSNSLAREPKSFIENYYSKLLASSGEIIIIINERAGE